MVKKRLITLLLSTLLAICLVFLTLYIPKMVKRYSLKGTIKKITQKAQTINNFKANMEIQILREKLSIASRATLLFERPRNSKIVEEMYFSEKWGEGPGQKQITITNDKVLWQYTPHLKIAIKLPLTAQSPPPIGAEFIDPFGFIEIKSLALVGKEKLNGKYCYILKGKTQDMAPLSERQKVTLWIDASEYLLYQIKRCSEAADEVSKITFTQVELNVDLEDKEFIFEPPEGTKIKNLDIQGPPPLPHS